MLGEPDRVVAVAVHDCEPLERAGVDGCQRDPPLAPAEELQHRKFHPPTITEAAIAGPARWDGVTSFMLRLRATHAFRSGQKGVDGRDKPGHERGSGYLPALWRMRVAALATAASEAVMMLLSMPTP